MISEENTTLPDPRDCGIAVCVCGMFGIDEPASWSHDGRSTIPVPGARCRSRCRSRFRIVGSCSRPLIYMQRAARNLPPPPPIEQRERTPPLVMIFACPSIESDSGFTTPTSSVPSSRDELGLYTPPRTPLGPCPSSPRKPPGFSPPSQGSQIPPPPVHQRERTPPPPPPPAQQ